MARFLSDEWIDALDRALADAAPADPAATLDGSPLVVEQCVTRPDGDPVVYHVVLGDGRARAVPGPAPEPTLRFTQDRDTAWAIGTGRQSAQAAFMTGRLQVGGDLRALLDERLVGQLGDAFAAVRAGTTEP